MPDVHGFGGDGERVLDLGHKRQLLLSRRRLEHWHDWHPARRELQLSVPAAESRRADRNVRPSGQYGPVEAAPC
jgi:hypothetical protein